jgi:hypothetical protein
MRRPLAVLLALVLMAALAPVALAKPHGGPAAPAIGIKGSSFSVSVNAAPTPTVVGRFEVTFDARKNGRKASGTLSFRSFGCLTANVWDPGCTGADTSMHQVGYGDVAIDCLVADAPTHTVWFSGRTKRGVDLRLPFEELLQELSIIDNRDEVVFGRLRDSDGDGSADERSLFFSTAKVPYPNALTIDAVDFSPWHLAAYDAAIGSPMSSANACTARDALYTNADYQVIDGSTNELQWHDANTYALIGSTFEGTAANLANPPLAAIYDLSAITRALGDEGLILTFN